MKRTILLCLAAAAGVVSVPAWSQATRPQIETRKVEGTDGVYIFRNGNHQSLFVVTKDGVIATDPIGYGRPTGGADYVAEIRKVTDKPIKYLVYSHHHYDHIAGGQAFKDAGAKIVAHKRAKERLAQLNDPHTPLPDEVFDKSRTLTLGGTKLEMTFVGLNHSDSTLVMRLPKEKILFVVDLVPVGTFPGRGMIDFYPLESLDSMNKILAMDWERLIPGHPGQPADRLGTKKDVEEQIALQQYASDQVKVAAQQGKCWDGVEKEMQLDKYKDMPGYAGGLPMVLRRYCGLWGRGT
jgi:glyoxylase-like metal-dependent hydrolase (beta-lactamase superfamily II)